MYLQQVHWGLNAGENFNKFEINKFVKAESKRTKTKRMRPFQLAFNEQAQSRGDAFPKEENNTIDLIWFPTGRR